jgi:UDP-glucose 4-epimerase
VKAVVTGAAGFIGSHLTESLLADGFEVVGIDAFVDYYPRPVKEKNLSGPRDHRAFRFVEGLVQDLDLRPHLDGALHVYHGAASSPSTPTTTSSPPSACWRPRS